MRFDVYRIYGIGAQAEVSARLVERGSICLATDEGAGVELVPGSFECRFRGFHLHVRQAEAKRGQRVIRVVINHVNAGRRGGPTTPRLFWACWGARSAGRTLPAAHDFYIAINSRHRRVEN